MTSSKVQVTIFSRKESWLQLKYVISLAFLVAFLSFLFLSGYLSFGTTSNSSVLPSSPQTTLNSHEDPLLVLPLRTYEPSKAESIWMTKVQEWSSDPCSPLASPEYSELTQSLLNVMMDMESRDIWEEFDILDPSFESTLRSNPEFFSHMRYDYKDGSVKRVAMEPLIGPLRDPRPICLGKHINTWSPPVYGSPAEQLNQGLNWVILDPVLKDTAAVGAPKLLLHAPRMTNYRRALLFDMGGMKWNQEGSAWLHRQLSRMGVHLEHIYIWEATQLSSQDFFGSASLDVLSRVHFFNWPVSSEIESPSNPFTLIKQIVTPEDFVLVKLDIDNPSIEGDLVNQLLSDKVLAELVDEFFFEHHVDMPPMHYFWGYPLLNTLADSYRIFSELRHQGIHAHSWP